MLLKADGFDAAIIGISRVCATPDRIAYDYDKCIEILMNRDGMEWEEAVEFLEFKVLDVYMGETTPTFVRVLTMEEFNDYVDDE
jgi:hypothetical protein